MTDQLYQRVREVVSLSGSRFVSASFIKKDGTERRIVFQPRYVAYIKGPDAAPSAQQAAETRKRNHPELYNVFCCQKRGARSINMDTLIHIKVRGSIYVRQGDDLVLGS